MTACEGTFAPDPAGRLTAYGTASRASYAGLLGSLARLSDDDHGDALAAAEARVRLMQAHLAEVGQLRDFYGMTP